MSSMTIRPASAQDAPAIARILAEVAEEGMLGTEPPVDLDERAAKFAETIDGDGPGAFWLLEEDDRAVGWAAVLPRAAGVLSLAMAILAEARGRGGGRSLVETALGHARAGGAHKLELEVWPDNARAIALYAATGFEVEGLRRCHYRRRDGTLRGTLIMARLLA
jgi:ribosomal protein S18 acetylase RimI-like enzyme